MSERRKSQRRKTGLPLDLDAALAALDGLSIKELRKIWQVWLGATAPPCQSKDVLRRLLAWRLQEERFGGLPTDIRRKLKQLRPDTGNDAGPAPTASAVLKPGTMITREWRSKVQRVHVLEDGFAHNGKRYGSLSEIARAITGKRWSGPRFFGTEAKNALATAEPQDGRRSVGS